MSDLQLEIGQLAVMVRTLDEILDELRQDDRWHGAGFFRMQEEGGFVSRVPSAQADTKLLGANRFRRQAIVYNESTAVLYVAYANIATVTDYTVQVPAAGTLLIDKYVGPVRGIWAAANGFAQVTEV